jgi:predicted ATPase
VYEIVGRDEELASLRAFIGRSEGEPTALVLEGQAGIGKSTPTSHWSDSTRHKRASSA